jgi:hypothetical protein
LIKFGPQPALDNQEDANEAEQDQRLAVVEVQLARQHVMKRKLVIAGAGVLLFSSALVWLSRPSSASPGQEFSPADFTRIRQVIRQAVWRTALPDVSPNTIKALPHWFRRLGSSRIRQIAVAPAGAVMVQVQSSSGTDCYSLQKYQRSGRWDWRVVPFRIVINLNGAGPGYSEFRVDGGFALLGGQISSEPVDWLPPLARRGWVSSGGRSLPQSELSAAGSNQVRLTYEAQSVPWEDPPGYTPPWRKVVSETPFSASLSNTAGLNLRP